MAESFFGLRELCELRETPALREVLEGYKLFNAWEFEGQCWDLQSLSVAKCLTQYCDLCGVAHALTPNAEQIFLAQDTMHWETLREKLKRAAEVMGDARPARGTDRGQ